MTRNIAFQLSVPTFAMKKLVTRITDRIWRFHRSENGSNALETVMLLAIAAMLGVAIYKIGGLLVQFLEDCLYGFGGEEQTCSPE